MPKHDPELTFDELNDDPILTLAQAAAYLGVSTRYLYRVNQERRIRVIKYGGGTTSRGPCHYRQSDLDAFVEASTVEPIDG